MVHVCVLTCTACVIPVGVVVEVVVSYTSYLSYVAVPVVVLVGGVVVWCGST